MEGDNMAGGERREAQQTPHSPSCHGASDTRLHRKKQKCTAVSVQRALQSRGYTPVRGKENRKSLDPTSSMSNHCDKA